VLNHASTIREIRKRLKLSMTEFAELIGTEQSTISRYEAGQIEPSRTVWILLFLLASGGEREAILEAMGEGSESSLASRYQNAEESLKLLKSKKTDVNRIEFAEASTALLASKESIDPVLVQVLKLYPSKKFRQALAAMLPYFEFVANREA